MRAVPGRAACSSPCSGASSYWSRPLWRCCTSLGRRLRSPRPSGRSPSRRSRRRGCPRTGRSPRPSRPTPWRRPRGCRRRPSRPS
ncbi:MAG TPA: hypothetical protein DCM05_01505 [Elusimicrobia bacterium]|nr:hypothetical protein [Elusimicrobiota bacterium]